MKKRHSFKWTGLLAVGVGLALTHNSLAVVSTWNGGDGEYTAPDKWSPNGVPDLSAAGNTAKINSGAVAYTPGGDFFLNSGSTLQISGGSFVQVGGDAWMNFQGGNLLVDGGTFSQGSAGAIVRDPTSSVTVSAGTLNLNGDLIYDTANIGALSLSGLGKITSGEFKPVEDFTMVGGILDVHLISFSVGPGGIDLSGGRFEVNGLAAGNGLYGASLAKGVNFTTGSTGSLYFKNMNQATFNGTGFLADGKISLNGAANPSAFTTTEIGGGVLVAIPEATVITILGFSGLLILTIRRFLII